MNNDEISQNKETDTSLQFLPSTSIEPSINEKNENETSKDITYNESFETACSKSFSEFGTERGSHSEFGSSLTVDNAQDITEKEISPWEQWLFEKEKERRKQFLKKKEERKQKLMIEQKEKEIEYERKVRAENAYKKWLHRIQENQKKQFLLQKEKTEKEKNDKEEKEKTIRILSEKKFKQWKKEKQKLED
ncbi:coiled-coil domain-containing protein 34-like, partial [Centruroides sculpturatus]|uniref:coiled-coil domain-containing protein 34-like n=1 Tax=Centruroides sculpturatus TaxID=218467 RepID=UPI000C6DF201